MLISPLFPSFPLWQSNLHANWGSWLRNLPAQLLAWWSSLITFLWWAALSLSLSLLLPLHAPVWLIHWLQSSAVFPFRSATHSRQSSPCQSLSLTLLSWLLIWERNRLFQLHKRWKCFQAIVLQWLSSESLCRLTVWSLVPALLSQLEGKWWVTFTY